MTNSKLKALSLAELQAVIFDLDGTLVDTMPVIVSTVVRGLKKRGVKISPTTFGNRIFEEFFGAPLPKGSRMIPTLMYRIARISELGYAQSCFFSLETTFRLRKAYDKAGLLPGAVELLDKLRNQEILLALVSMGSRKSIIKILERTRTREYFSIIISRDEVKRQKPDPEGYLLVQQAMGIAAEKIAVVGDMPIDILAAQRAGMPSIAVTTGLADEKWFQDPVKPNSIVSSLIEIRELLEA
ncbi:MAG: HAD family hydrolase [Candidatus Thorarchaeota archaeon]